MRAAAAVAKLDAVGAGRDERAALRERLLEEGLVVVATHPLGIAAAADEAQRSAPLIVAIDPESGHPFSVGPDPGNGRDASARS